MAAAAQGHQAGNAHALELLQLGTHRGAGSANAGKVRGGGHAFLLDGIHHGEGARLRGAACAVGDGAKLGPTGVQRLAHMHMFGRAFGGFGGEKFKADG